MRNDFASQVELLQCMISLYFNTNPQLSAGQRILSTPFLISTARYFIIHCLQMSWLFICVECGYSRNTRLLQQMRQVICLRGALSWTSPITGAALTDGSEVWISRWGRLFWKSWTLAIALSMSYQSQRFHFLLNLRYAIAGTSGFVATSDSSSHPSYCVEGWRCSQWLLRGGSSHTLPRARQENAFQPWDISKRKMT